MKEVSVEGETALFRPLVFLQEAYEVVSRNLKDGVCESGGHLSRLGPRQGALCTTPPLGAGLLITPFRQLLCGLVSSTDLRYGTFNT